MMAFVTAAPWGIASAADMSLKAAPVPAAYNWSGFYGGLNAGWAEQDFRWAYTNPAPANCCSPFSTSTDGAFVGAQGGAQWQWNHIVLGVEAAVIQFAQTNWGSQSGCISGSSQTCQVRQAPTVVTYGGRLGWAMDKWLVYGTGGGATNGGVDSKLVSGAGATFDTTVAPRYKGWYAGVGTEYMLSKGSFADVIVGVEYQHIDLGTQYNASSADNFSPSPPGVNGRSISLKDDLVRFRLSLKTNPVW